MLRASGFPFRVGFVMLCHCRHFQGFLGFPAGCTESSAIGAELWGTLQYQPEGIKLLGVLTSVLLGRGFLVGF